MIESKKNDIKKTVSNFVVRRLLYKILCYESQFIKQRYNIKAYKLQ